MLRRVAGTLRAFLLVLGTCVVLWLPVSWYRALLIHSPWPLAGAQVYSAAGVIEVGVQEQAQFEFPFPLGVAFVPIGDRDLNPYWPRFERERSPSLTYSLAALPLWLLAAVCLALPITSFVLARRRRRGFGVEAKPVSGPGS